MVVTYINNGKDVSVLAALGRGLFKNAIDMKIASKSVFQCIKFAN